MVYHYSDVIKVQSAPDQPRSNANRTAAARRKAGGKSTKTSACAALLKYDVSSDSIDSGVDSGSESEIGSERDNCNETAGAFMFLRGSALCVRCSQHLTHNDDL